MYRAGDCGLGDMDSYSVWTSIGISLILFAIFWLALQRGLLRLDPPPFAELERLREEVDRIRLARSEAHARELQALREELERMRGLLAYEQAERHREREELHRQLTAAYLRIEMLEKKDEENQEKIAQLEEEITPGQVRVLGIWPHLFLNAAGERDAIRQAGIAYIPLWGEMATRKNILQKLRINGFSILEIGAHGDKDGIHIWGDDVLDVGFWYGALNRRTIRVALLLACYSDLSTADAFQRSGVQYVIATTGEVEDSDAVRFTEVFYQAYADGLDVPKAFAEALLVLHWQVREKFVLR